MKWKYQVTKWYMNEPFQALLDHLNQLGEDGWDVFHLHEAAIESKPMILIYSKKAERVPSTFQDIVDDPIRKLAIRIVDEIHGLYGEQIIMADNLIRNYLGKPKE